MAGDTNHADEGQHAAHGSANVRVQMVGYDRPLLFALVAAACLTLSCLALLQADRAEREARLAEYYAVDLEVCILKGVCPNKNGAPVPADPWGHHQQGGKKQ